MNDQNECHIRQLSCFNCISAKIEEHLGSFSSFKSNCDHYLATFWTCPLPHNQSSPLTLVAIRKVLIPWFITVILKTALDSINWFYGSNALLIRSVDLLDHCSAEICPPINLPPSLFIDLLRARRKWNISPSARWM